MKEEILKHLIAAATQYDAQITFLLGMLGCVIVLLLLMLLIALKRIFSGCKYKINGITLTAEHGSVFIAANAIADLVRAIGNEFAGLEIHKVYLLKIRKELSIRVYLHYLPKDQSMLDFASVFQNRLLDALKVSFGIDSIAKIDLVIPKGKS